METVQFLITLVIDGFVLIAAGALCRWAMPQRYTVRFLLVVTTMLALSVGILNVMATR